VFLLYNEGGSSFEQQGRYLFQLKNPWYWTAWAVASGVDVPGEEVEKSPVVSSASKMFVSQGARKSLARLLEYGQLLVDPAYTSR